MKYTCNIFHGHVKDCHALLRNEFFGVIYTIFKNSFYKKYNNFYDNDVVDKTAMILYMYIHDEDVSSLYNITREIEYKENFKYVSSFLALIDRQKDEINKNIKLKTCMLRYLHLFNWSDDIVQYYLSRSCFAIKSKNKK